MSEELYEYSRKLVQKMELKEVLKEDKINTILDYWGINNFYKENNIRALDAIPDPSNKITKESNWKAALFFNNFAIINNTKKKNYTLVINNGTYLGRNVMHKIDHNITFFFYKIKSIEKSVEFFGHKKIKESLLDSKQLFKIKKYLPAYTTSKSKTPVDVVTIETEDGKSYKFVATELEVVFPNVKNLIKGYNPPIDRKLKNGSIAKVNKKTNTDLKYGERVIVKEVMRAGHKKYCIVNTASNKNYTIEQNKLKVVKC